MACGLSIFAGLCPKGSPFGTDMGKGEWGSAEEKLPSCLRTHCSLRMRLIGNEAAIRDSSDKRFGLILRHSPALLSSYPLFLIAMSCCICICCCCCCMQTASRTFICPCICSIGLQPPFCIFGIMTIGVLGTLLLRYCPPTGQCPAKISRFT